MDFDKLLNITNIDLYEIIEPSINSLRLCIERCKVSERPEELKIGNNVLNNLYPVIPADDLPVLQVDFNSYIAYSIRNESFTEWDDSEIFIGESIRIYTKSRYLDYIKISTFACDDYPGPFVHYGFCCFNHIIDVVSVEPPTIAEVGHDD